MTEMSKEYGTALFMLGCECGAQKEYAAALETVSAVFRKFPAYIDFLSSPNIPMSERLTAIEQAFSPSLPENVVSFLQLLCEKGRIRSFDGCVQEYNALLKASEHISTAKVVSAVELTQDEKKRLQAKLEKMCGNPVIMDCSTDKSLMGGVVIELDGKVMDGSLRRRLHEVKDVMGR